MKKIVKKSTKKAVKKVTKKAVVKKSTKKPIKPVKKFAKAPKAKTVIRIPRPVEVKVDAEFTALTKSKEYAEFVKYVDILQQRWMVSKKYEKFESYIAFIKTKLPTDLELVKMTTNFTLNLKYKNAAVLVTTTAREVASNLYFPLS